MEKTAGKIAKMIKEMVVEITADMAETGAIVTNLMETKGMAIVAMTALSVVMAVMIATLAKINGKTETAVTTAGVAMMTEIAIEGMTTPNLEVVGKMMTSWSVLLRRSVRLRQKPLTRRTRKESKG